MSTPLSTARTARYRIVYSPLATRFKIADELWGGAYCALPDASGYLKQLTFRNAKEARAWLAKCGQAS
jgi:hypothetical protein